MAVGSGGVSGKKDRVKSPLPLQKKELISQENALPSPPSKRNKSPGIRVVGGRIYDPVNGKTCHQCRQKTRDFVAACRSLTNKKPCPIMFCHKCLLNRYGEKAEEVDTLGDWSCPRCRGICNCSICRKKGGHQPTGILINTAKATGYSSVSEMLLKGGETLNQEKVDAIMVASPKKAASPKKDVAALPKKAGKENSFDEVDANLSRADKKTEEGHKGVDVIKKLKELKRPPKDSNLSRVDKKTKEGHKGVDVIKKSKEMKRPRMEETSSLDDGKKLKKAKKNELEKDDSKRTDDGKKLKKSKKNELEKDDSKRIDDGKKLKKAKKNELEKDDSKNIDDGKKLKKTKKNELEKDDSKRTDDGKKLKKTKKNELEKDDSKKTDATLTRRMSPRKSSVCKETTNEEAHMIKEDEANASNDKAVSQQIADLYVQIPVPMGTELNSVSKIDVHTDDVGSALQLSEFCTVFQKILNVKKGHAEYVLQDLLHGRTGRRGKFTATAQFHILLLSFLQEDQEAGCENLSASNGKSLWFHALKKHFSESRRVPKAQCLDALGKASDYEALNASEKLCLLNLLCDEVLATEKMRTWMEDQNSKFAEKVKEARHKHAAARQTEKDLKQKLKDDIAKAVIASGKALSISEHDAILAQIKSETEEAHAKVLESKGMLLESNRSCDAVRIDPIFVGRGGNVYWKLKCSGNSSILRQNVGEGDDLTLNDKWFAIGEDEEKQALEKHICSARSREKKAKIQK